MLASHFMLEKYSEYLRTRKRGFLATTSDGRVTVVPICFVRKEDTIYSAIDRKPKGRRLARLENIESNPDVAFIVDNYSEDWRDLSYLLIHGRAALVKDRREAGEARDLLLSRYPQYRWLKLSGSRIIAIHASESKFWKFRR